MFICFLRFETIGSVLIGGYPVSFGSVRPKLTYSIFPIWDDNAREQFEFAPGH